MAHFAQLDNDKVVTNVIVVSNADTSVNGVEDESVGIAFCKKLLGQDTNWIQTSYNGNFRGKYAGIGDTYDAVKDTFIPAQPFPSWVLTEANVWEAPIPRPVDDNFYFWDEETLNWKIVIVEGA